MAATYAFDVTAAEVKAEQLEYLQSYKTVVMDDAIERAASDLNIMLRALRMAPNSITAVNAVDDYNWCRSVIMLGAAGYYLKTVTGTWENGAGQRVADMQSQIKMLRDMPQMLQSYNPDASSTSSARSRANHNPGQSLDTATRRASARFARPDDPRRWRY